MVGTLLHIPVDAPAKTIVTMPLGATLDDANYFAADLLDAEYPLEVHEIDTDIKVFTLVQDGMYEYNRGLTLAIDELLGIKVALEGPVVICMLPPEILSR
tara:strand:- start:556 stop:855 length:300 start_codon:yes stop_codon:yes gene_type:complete